ncbi:FG-GAP-like repeat-containing protein [Pseudomonas aeruginosa]|uniref:FG-GAP-like repeat-containing protein n=1 Tax=Pseudomonas aeruginosa TaxID=287 RepID=UPI003D28765D
MAICLMVGDATAAGWRSANFRVYSGDYNGDGQPDLYLKAVTSVVVVGGEVATPIPLLPPLKNVVLLRNGASYSALYDPPAADLNAVAWTAAPYQSFIGDLNRDGILDLILQPNDSSDSLLIVSGNPSAHGVLQVASGTGLGTEIGYDAGARFALGDWLGNGGTSIRVSHPTQGQSTLFIDAGGQLVARYLSVPTPLPGVVLGKAAEAFTALNLLAPQAGVRGDGGVDYRYPLELPPGIAGLQPELALVQGGGGGVLGEGWSLAGLSSIERCPASIAQDGQNRQVGLLESDRLCLDGMRLQLLSGEYFKPGSVYRTEIDSFSRVQATGSAASLGFEVRTRDGRILTYGGAAAIKAQGAAVPYQWGISSATDRFGNTIEYRYLAANSLAPSEILYAGNRVSFEYAGALRSVPRYFAGGYTSATHVLTAVAVRGPAAQQLFRTELAYERTQGDASKVRLKQVQRCAWGSAGKECLSPVAFDYLAGVYGYTGTAESAGLDKFDYVLISQASFVTADLNGDGRHALVNATMGKLKAVTYDGGSLVERLLYDADNTPLFSLTRMDFNGDGKDEILFLRMRKDPNSANADMQWMLYTANGVVALGDTWTAPPAGPNGIVYSLAGGSTGFATYAPLVADLDQNGSLDLFLPINGSWVAYLNRSGAIPSFARSALLSGFKTIDYGWFSYWGSDPGGGVRLASGKAGKLSAGIWRSGSGMAPAAMVDLGIELARALTADVNGDGQMDYLVPNASGKVDLLLNTGGPLSAGLFQRLGTSLSAAQLLPEYRFRASLQDYAAKAVDYDGDGREEILYPRASGTFGLLRFTGNGFEELDSGVPLSRRLATSTTQLDKSCQDALAVWKRIMDTAPDAAGRESASWLYYQTAANCGFSPEGLLVDPYEMFVADVNGDGFQDVLVGGSLVVEPLRRSIRWRAFLHNRRSPELLSRIDAGSGNSLGIEYARLNDPAVHTPQVSAFPQVSLNIPRPVVSRLRVADGIGGTRDYQYLYQGGAAGPARPRLPRFPPDGGSRSGTRAHPGEDVAPGLPLRRAPGQRGNQPRRKTPGASAEPVEVRRDHRRQVFLRLPGPVQRGTLRPGRAGQRHAAQGGDGRELRQSHPGDRGNCRQPDRRNLAQPGGGAPVQQRRRLLAGWFRHPRNRKYQWRQRQQVAGAIAQRAAGDSSAGQRNIFQWLARCGDHPSIQLRWQRPDRPDYHQRRRTGGAQRTVRRLPGALAGHSVQCPRPCRALRLRGGPRPTDQQGRRQRPGRELSLRRFRPGNPAPLRRR